MKTFIDIGCRVGAYALVWAADPSALVYAFEPEPKAYQDLVALGLPNLRLFDWAVATTEGSAPFHVATNPGASSLKEFAPDNPRYVTKEIIQVRTVRLDTFMVEQSIDLVEFLKSDTQGSDLDVLQSLGSRIVDVKRLLVEAWLPGKNLYVAEGKAAAIDQYVKARGFRLLGNRQSGHSADLYYENTRFR